MAGVDTRAWPRLRTSFRTPTRAPVLRCLAVAGALRQDAERWQWRLSGPGCHEG